MNTRQKKKHILIYPYAPALNFYCRHSFVKKKKTLYSARLLREFYKSGSYLVGRDPFLGDDSLDEFVIHLLTEEEGELEL